MKCHAFLDSASVQCHALSRLKSSQSATRYSIDLDCSSGAECRGNDRLCPLPVSSAATGKLTLARYAEVLAGTTRGFLLPPTLPPAYISADRSVLMRGTGGHLRDPDDVSTHGELAVGVRMI